MEAYSTENLQLKAPKACSRTPTHCIDMQQMVVWIRSSYSDEVSKAFQPCSSMLVRSVFFKHYVQCLHSPTVQIKGRGQLGTLPVVVKVKWK